MAKEMEPGATALVWDTVLRLRAELQSSLDLVSWRDAGVLAISTTMVTANSLKGNGRLGKESPTGAAFDAYAYDPAKPTRSPYTGGHVDGRLTRAFPQSETKCLSMTRLF